MTTDAEIDQADIAPSLDLDSILSIHRQEDGYIGFVRKPDPQADPPLDKYGKPKQFENLFSIRTGDLKEMFPAIAHWLTHDAYMTVNAYYRPAPYPNKQTDLPDVWRKEQELRYLNACYVDVDCGREDSDEVGASLSYHQAIFNIGVLIDMGVIPQPSLTARSGRGAYLFWLLVDPDKPNAPQRAWPDKIDRYKQINKQLMQRIRSNRLPADPNAIDAARVLRVPNSMHRKVLKRATYDLHLDATGKGYLYTMPDLASFLSLPDNNAYLPDSTKSKAKQRLYRKTINKGSAPSRINGKLRLNALRAKDLVTLSNARGGYSKRGNKHIDGTVSIGRRFILNLYTHFLKDSNTAKDDALEAVSAMAANMNPAWPDEPDDPTLEGLVDEIYKESPFKKIYNKTLCKWLGITADLAKEIDLETIVPDEVKAERENAIPLQRDIIAARREWLLDYITEHPHPAGGGRWTSRKVASTLSRIAPHGWNNHTTANNDLNAIGYKTQRSHGGRKRKEYNPNNG